MENTSVHYFSIYPNVCAGLLGEKKQMDFTLHLICFEICLGLNQKSHLHYLFQNLPQFKIP